MHAAHTGVNGAEGLDIRIRAVIQRSERKWPRPVTMNNTAGGVWPLCPASELPNTNPWVVAVGVAAGLPIVAGCGHFSYCEVFSPHQRLEGCLKRMFRLLRFCLSFFPA